jgi:flagellar basal body-associated protein FliL
MSESPEPGVDSEPEATKPNRQGRALTWIGIVAGTVLILGVIFVAGAATTGWHDHQQQQAISMPQKGDPPRAGPAGGDKCCCEKMAKK